QCPGGACGTTPPASYGYGYGASYAPSYGGSACGAYGCQPAVGSYGYSTACGSRSVWVPNIVQRPVQVTVNKWVQETQPYEYQVTLYRPETRTRNVPVCEMVTEQQPYQYQVTTFRPE